MSIKHTAVTIDPFIHLLEMETKAYNLYSKYVERLEDEELKQMFLFIREQEKRHMEIAKKLIKLVK